MVSTRAPAKGATDVAIGLGLYLAVSTRAPAKGATTSLVTVPYLTVFQLALPRRERL